MLYKFEQSHNVTETTNSICSAKSEGAVYHGTITRWFKKFCMGSKNLNDQAMSGRPKTIAQTIETTPARSSRRVSGEVVILQFRRVRRLYDLGPIGRDCRIHWLHLCREVRLPQRVSWYDTKQSYGEAPVMLEYVVPFYCYRSQVHFELE